MPVDDLSSISGLDDRRRDVLAKLEVSTYYELIMTDRQRIVDAFGRRVIRPTLEEVSAWQDEARRMRAASIDASVSATAPSGWQSAATFVVAFEERQQGEALDRRIVVEQTEVEPEASPQQRSQWPGWTCDVACRWMLERVGGPTSPDLPGPAQAALPTQAPPAQIDAGEVRAAGARATIDIERANLIDSSGSSELVAASRPAHQDRLVWSQPAQLIVKLGPGQSGPRTSVVLQLAQVSGPKQHIACHFDETGQVAEVDLSGLTDGEYMPTIVASARDGSFLPRIVKLPAVEVVGSAEVRSSRRLAGAGRSSARCRTRSRRGRPRGPCPTAGSRRTARSARAGSR